MSIRMIYWGTDITVDEYVEIDDQGHRGNTNEDNTEFISSKCISGQTAVWKT